MLCCVLFAKVKVWQVIFELNKAPAARMSFDFSSKIVSGNAVYTKSSSSLKGLRLAKENVVLCAVSIVNYELRERNLKPTIL